MDLIVIDFETYYDRLFSLSKMSTEEYVRSDQFEVIGVSVKENDNEAVWFSGTHEETASFLASYSMHDKFVVGHNMRFDASILSWRFGIHPRGIGDTMGMGQILHGLTESVALKSLSELYGIGQKGTEVEDALGKRRNTFSSAELARYGEYCKNDVELTHKLFYKMLPRIPKQELKLIDLTIRMFTEPTLKLNKALLLGHLHNIRRAKETLLASANVEKDELMSNPKFAELLKSLGVEPPMKTSPTTGKETFAFAKTDEAFKELLEHEDHRVQVLAAARLGNKSTIEESRTEQFIQIANRGLLPVPLKYAGAVVSHRWSGCLIAETEIIVYDPKYGVTVKPIVDVMRDDLVWDGIEFVQHEGVTFSGYREVIQYGGITATPEHIVFTECGKEVALVQAQHEKYNLKDADRITDYHLEAAKAQASSSQL